MTAPARTLPAPPAPSRLPRPLRQAAGAAAQAAALGAAAVAIAALFWFGARNLESRGLAGGFGYLGHEAGFGIGETLIAFSPSDTFLRAFVAAVLNTIAVSAVSIVAATAIGFCAGLMRLSRHWLPRLVATAYVELFRNTPQLLQIIFWYSAARHFPVPRQAWQMLPGVFLSNRGMQMPWIDPASPWQALAAAVLAAAACGAAWHWAAARRHARTGRRLPVLLPCLLLLAGAPLLAWLALGSPDMISRPRLQGLNFVGGRALSPEFIALFLGLSLYIGAFVCEIVRGAIQALDRGQTEAARSLGLPTGLTYRLVLIPQAVRAMLPPLAAQYISLLKNSSLAVAIGYPDVVNITKTTINQTGHVIEAIVLMSAVYLLISLSISLAMQTYERALHRRGGSR